MGTNAQQKPDALTFWNNHGLDATRDAFKVGRSTLYRWRKAHHESGLSRLHDRSRAPHQRRRRNWPPALCAEIRRLRNVFPNLGKDKLHVLLRPWCERHELACPSVSTIERLIGDTPDKMRLVPTRLAPKGKAKSLRRQRFKQRLGKGFCADYPGHCVAFDTVVRFVGRTRRYLLTATDHASRFALAIAVSRHDSQHAARFAALVKTLFPGRIEQILTDNGSEFQGAFADYARAQGWRHCHTYPRSPKMNAFNERFSRTVQEDFVDYEEDLLAEDLRAFNQHLPDYLDRYNGQRPHRGLNNQTPCQMLAQYLPDLSLCGGPHTCL